MYREQVELLSQVAREMEKLREELKERYAGNMKTFYVKLRIKAAHLEHRPFFIFLL